MTRPVAWSTSQTIPGLAPCASDPAAVGQTHESSRWSHVEAQFYGTFMPRGGPRVAPSPQHAYRPQDVARRCRPWNTNGGSMRGLAIRRRDQHGHATLRYHK